MLTIEVVEKARRGNLAFFESLDDTELQNLSRDWDDDGRTLLHTACSSGNASLVRLLLGASEAEAVNRVDDSGWSPLISACSCASDEIVKLLVDEADADVTIKTPEGRNALFYAASKATRATCIFDVLLRGDPGRVAAMISSRDCTKSTPLHRAAAVGNIEGIRKMMEVYTEPKKQVLCATDAAKETPLHVAIGCQHPEAAKQLIAYGADLNAPPNEEGETPIDIARRLMLPIEDVC